MSTSNTEIVEGLLKQLDGECPGIPFLRKGETRLMAYSVNIGLPFLIGISTIGYVFANPCFSPGPYRYQLFWGMWGIYLTMFMLLLARALLFSKNVCFCTESQRDRHRMLQWTVFLFFSASFDYYQVFAQSLNAGYIGGGVACIFFTFTSYIFCFFVPHLRQCRSEHESDKIDRGWIKAVDFFWVAGFIVIIGIAGGYNSQLDDVNWRQSLVPTCVNGTFNSTM
jgi:hypothetical protein